MKIKNSMLGLALVFTMMTLTGLNAKAETPFSYWEEVHNDKSSTWNWAESAIHWAHADGVSVGRGKDQDSLFCPDQPITRAEAVKMLICYQEMDVSGYDTETSVFKDAGGEWFTPYVNAAYDYDIVVGKGEGYFDPYGELTRAEAVTILVNALYHEDPNTAADSFEDIADKWYTPYVNAAYAAGWVTGKSENCFDPENSTTRAEWVRMLYNIEMKAFAEDVIYGILIDANADSFTAQNGETTLFSYDRETNTAVGDVAVKVWGNYLMVYFTPCTSLELLWQSADADEYLRVFSTRGDFDVAAHGTNMEKIVVGADSSVEFHCVDPAECVNPAFFPSGMGAYTIVNEEGKELRYEGPWSEPEYGHYSVSSYGTTVRINETPSRFYRFTPTQKSGFTISGYFNNLYN